MFTWARRVDPSDVRFFVTFAVIAAGLLCAYCYPYADGSTPDQLLTQYLSAYARLAGGLLRFFDPSVRVTGQILEGRTAIKIVRDCDAMVAIVLLVSGVLAYRTPLPRKGVGLMVGIALIAAMNIIRIWSMYFAGIYWPAGFDFVHRELWPPLLVVWGLLVFLRWVSWTEARAGHAPA